MKFALIFLLFEDDSQLTKFLNPNEPIRRRVMKMEIFLKGLGKALLSTFKTYYKTLTK